MGVGVGAASTSCWLSRSLCGTFCGTFCKDRCCCCFLVGVVVSGGRSENKQRGGVKLKGGFFQKRSGGVVEKGVVGVAWCFFFTGSRQRLPLLVESRQQSMLLPVQLLQPLKYMCMCVGMGCGVRV